MNPTSQPLSFEQAIAKTETLLDQQADHSISDQDFGKELELLFQTENGARGFFVTFLTGEWQVADQNNPAIIAALTAYPQAELLVKNLVMSTAMAIIHRRNQNFAQVQGSERVATRTAQLINQLESPQIQAIAQQMVDSAKGDSQVYSNFLQKWGYDPEQKIAIANCLTSYLA
jgi:hypothetical protein